MIFYIIAAIVLLLIIILYSPFKFIVSCAENKLSLSIKYLFFKKLLFPKPESGKKKSFTKKKTEKKKDKSSEKIQKKKKNKLLPEDRSEQIAFIINILKSSGKFLKHFSRGIVIKDISADIDISDEDACECAIKFGKANIIIFNILSFCSVFFRLKKKHINVNCVYNKPESVYNFGFTVQFTPAAGILSVLAFIITFFVNNRKTKSNSKQQLEC